MAKRTLNFIFGVALTSAWLAGRYSMNDNLQHGFDAGVAYEQSLVSLCKENAKIFEAMGEDIDECVESLYGTGEDETISGINFKQWFDRHDWIKGIFK